MEKQFYDGTKLLSLTDADGNKPEIFICTSNRSAGKTTYFSRLCVNRFLRFGEKFLVLYRFKDELLEVADKFFKDIGGLFFPEYTMTAVKRDHGSFMELYLAKGEEKPVSCGYCVALNTADKVKKCSHLLSDVVRIIFDEFQSETNNYCPKEFLKFISIHTSVARGGGKQARYLPVYMISNPVSLINPYYTGLGISERLTKQTKFLKGHGYVLEQGHNDAAAQAINDTGFYRAVSENKYMGYVTEGNYLADSDSFIETPVGRNRYLMTLKYEDAYYAIREYIDAGVLFCDDRPDMTYPLKIAVTTEDHQVNYVMLRNSDMYIERLRYFFEKGCFRFRNLRSKQALLTMISY